MRNESTDLEAGLLAAIIVLVTVILVILLLVLDGGRHVEPGIGPGLLHLLLRSKKVLKKFFSVYQ